MKILSDKFKNTLWVRYFAFTKIPMIYYTKPSVVELNEERCIIKIPFLRKNRNHQGSMYFGVLSVGADLAGGIIAMKIIQKSRKNVSLLFKNISGDFLSRVESDAYFICNDGPAISKAVQETIATKERVNLPVTINVKTSLNGGDEPLAKFILTLSLKDKS